MAGKVIPPAAEPTSADEQLLNCAGPRLLARHADDPARLDRMRAELERGFRLLGRIQRGVSVFGSARTPSDDPDYALACETARSLGREGFTIITGGGPGIMEAANKGAREAPTLSVGLNIQLPFEQHLNPYVDVSMRFEHFFARKVMFVRYASAFVVFPGGYGTLDELFESLTLIQTGTIKHFPVLLVGSAYWKGLVDWAAEQLVRTGKIEPAEHALLHVVDEPEEVCRIVGAAYEKQAAPVPTG
jgi:uncharacterized protein (TIGR00730 family)